MCIRTYLVLDSFELELSILLLHQLHSVDIGTGLHSAAQIFPTTGGPQLSEADGGRPCDGGQSTPGAPPSCPHRHHPHWPLFFAKSSTSMTTNSAYVHTRFINTCKINKNNPSPTSNQIPVGPLKPRPGHGLWKDPRRSEEIIRTAEVAHTMCVEWI